MNKWKKFLLILMSAFIALGGTYAYLISDFKREMISPVTWQSYSPHDQRFNIKFPLSPTESYEEISIANKRIEFHQLSAEHEKAFYAVSYLDFPSHWKWLGSQKLLSKSFEMLMKNEPNIEAILQQEFTRHLGDPALIYKVNQGGKEITGKFVITGNTLYRVAVSYPITSNDQFDPQLFIDSFKINS